MSARPGRAAATRFGLVAALAAAALASGGCAETFDARALGVPVTMAAPAGTAPAGTAFSVTTRSVFGFWGLVSFKQPSLQKALAAQLVGGKSVANLRVRVRSRFTDVLITALTAGIVVPRAVTFEGVITGAPGAATGP